MAVDEAAMESFFAALAQARADYAAAVTRRDEQLAMMESVRRDIVKIGMVAIALAEQLGEELDQSMLEAISEAREALSANKRRRRG